MSSIKPLQSFCFFKQCLLHFVQTCQKWISLTAALDLEFKSNKVSWSGLLDQKCSQYFYAVRDLSASSTSYCFPWCMSIAAIHLIPHNFWQHLKAAMLCSRPLKKPLLPHTIPKYEEYVAFRSAVCCRGSVEPPGYTLYTISWSAAVQDLNLPAFYVKVTFSILFYF